MKSCTTAKLSVVLTDLGRPLPGCLSVVPWASIFWTCRSRLALDHPFCGNCFLRRRMSSTTVQVAMFYNNFIIFEDFPGLTQGRWRGRRPRARRKGAKRRSAEGGGRRSPSPVWGSRGIAPRKNFKFNVQIYAFSCYFCVKLYAESDDVLPLKYRVGNRYSLLSISLVGIWQQNLAHVCTSTIISYSYLTWS